MRQELVALWGRSNASREQLVEQLESWLQQAETSRVDRAAAIFQETLRLRLRLQSARARARWSRTRSATATNER